MNVFSFLSQAFERWPNRPAVIDDEGICTFADLYAMACTLRQQLDAHEVLPGKAVGMVAKNGRRFVAGLFALLGNGSVVMPIPPEVKPSELQSIAAHVSLSHIVIVDPSSPAALGPTRLAALSPGFGLATIGPVENIAPHVPNAAVIRFSSGTTSNAKGVVLSHQSIEERTAAGARGLGLQAGDTVTWVLPMAHHFIVSVLLYVRTGVTIAVAPSTLARSIIETTNQCHSSMLYASPLIIRLLAADDSNIPMPSLKRVISTASGLPGDASERFERRFGIPVSQAYGVIEVGLPLCNLENAPNESVGKPLPGYEAAILDEAGRVLPVNRMGRLGLRGPGMFDGYIIPARKRSEVLEHGWFMTGDLATITEDGTVTVRGREKSVINTAGNKVFPEEVEEVLIRHREVKAARVVGVTHPLLGELVTAEIVPLSENPNVEGIREHCYVHLSSYKVPKEFRLVESLPMTPTGKLMRHSG